MFFLVRVFVPYIEYQLNKKYIVEQLCVNRFVPETKCDGKCHIKKQIAALQVGPVDRPEENSKNTSKVNTKTFGVEFFLPFEYEAFLQPVAVRFGNRFFHFYSFFPNPPLRPPWSIV